MHQQTNPERQNPLLFAALAGFLAAAAPLFAQGGAGGGATSGGFSSFGSSIGNSSFGQSGFSGSSFGSSGFGQSGIGQSGFGSTATGAGGGFNTITNTDQGFVGRSAAGMQTFFGTTNQAFQTTDTRSSRSGGGGDASSEAGRRPPVRVSLSASPELRRDVAGARPRLDVAIDRIARRLTRRGMNGVTLSSDEGVATLEGVVESDSQRRLAEKLAVIEPGVRRVDNRLLVVEPAEEVYPELR